MNEMCAMPLAIAFMFAYPFPAIPFPKTVHANSKSDTEARISHVTANVDDEWHDRITVCAEAAQRAFPPYLPQAQANP